MNPLLHYYDPGSKQSLKEWKHANSPPPPTKFRQEKSSGKVLYSFLFEIIKE